MGTILELRGISKGFPGVKALSGIDLSVNAGEIHALLGENGAGKSTLMKILSGIYRPDEGHIVVDGQERHFHDYHDAVAAGIGIVFQEFSLIPYLNAVENIFLGRERRRFGLLQTASMRAEAVALAPPGYVIGTEVPTPGGATEALDHLEPTRPDAVLATYAIHEDAFRGVGGVWQRVLAVVVQPGVEFGHEEVVVYQPERARGLVAALGRMPGLVFEAHSTDYQPQAALRQLVLDGFAFLKVGPGLTFALREALYGLESIAAVLRPGAPAVMATLERLMLAQPGEWQSHYPGAPDDQRRLRHFSYSDRIRYYWPRTEARDAVAGLLAALQGVPIPATLLSQYLPRLQERVAAGEVEAEARTLLIEAVRDVLRSYSGACQAAGSRPAPARGHRSL